MKCWKARAFIAAPQRSFPAPLVPENPASPRILPIKLAPMTRCRLSQEAREKAGDLSRHQETEQKRRELEHKRAAMEGQIALLRSQFAEEENRLSRLVQEQEEREHQRIEGEAAMSRLRDVKSGENGRNSKAQGN
jgi:chromosome segregation ATPase